MSDRVEGSQPISKHLEPGHDIREALERHVAEYQAKWKLPWLTHGRTVQHSIPISALDGRYPRGEGPEEKESDNETISDVDMDSGEREADGAGESSLPQTTSRVLHPTTRTVRKPRPTKSERDLVKETARMHKDTAVLFGRNPTGAQVQQPGLHLNPLLHAAVFVKSNKHHISTDLPVNSFAQASMPSSAFQPLTFGKATPITVGQPQLPAAVALSHQSLSRRQQKKERKKLKTEKEAGTLSNGGPKAEALKVELANQESKKNSKKKANKQAKLEVSRRAERAETREVRNAAQNDAEKAAKEAAERKPETEAYTEQVKLERLRRREELMALLDRGPDQDPHPPVRQPAGNRLRTGGLKRAVIDAAEDDGELDEDDLP